ncbi:Hypothetical protein c3379 [Escherichia coli CFT073]|uniref:Uncharacterized protein n=1 Tax=Escherichia coli O6:H1 (strain CFT073 / ATCC 700928 / UPEC) TaxID=199310 RepID=A0A0H2VAB7_ECOL6|nr:Hypothetical protein c3379 [Escherichia coli CFT073]
MRCFFLPCDRELLIQFDHLFHVGTVDLLFVAISVFIRNHTGIVISLWFAVRDDGTSVIGVHHIVRTGTGAQGKSQHTGRNNCGSLFHHLLLKAINKS